MRDPRRARADEDAAARKKKPGFSKKPGFWVAPLPDYTLSVYEIRAFM